VTDPSHGGGASAPHADVRTGGVAPITAPVHPVPAAGTEPWPRRSGVFGLVDRALDRLDLLGDTVASAIGLR
jgi:hypothetical protein